MKHTQKFIIQFIPFCSYPNFLVGRVMALCEANAKSQIHMNP